jgi:hypothetical protein
VLVLGDDRATRLAGALTEGISCAGDRPTTIVVADGTGKDEKAARSAAFPEAVSQAVGPLIEAEVLVRNDRIVKDEVLEFSGSFIQTYETLAVESVAGGRIHVRIQHTLHHHG